MAHLTLEIPDELLAQLQASGQPLQETVLRAVEQYLRNQPKPITQTRQLMGTIKIPDPDPAFIVGYDQQGNPITNYAERINVSAPRHTGRDRF
jgi:hypothetical protein